MDPKPLIRLFLLPYDPQVLLEYDLGSLHRSAKNISRRCSGVQKPVGVNADKYFIRLPVFEIIDRRITGKGRANDEKRTH